MKIKKIFSKNHEQDSTELGIQIWVANDFTFGFFGIQINRKEWGREEWALNKTQTNLALESSRINHYVNLNPILSIIPHINHPPQTLHQKFSAINNLNKSANEMSSNF